VALSAAMAALITGFAIASFAITVPALLGSLDEG
jgi:hypothetical protein